MCNRKNNTVTTTKGGWGKGGGVNVEGEEVGVGLLECTLIPVDSAGLCPDVPRFQEASLMVM